MAEYDRYDTEGNGGFMMGLLTGTVIGAGLGMLLAPKAGSDLRGQVAEQARHFGSKASEQYRRASEAASGWAERGRDMVNQARDAVNRGAEEARGYAGSTTGSSYNTGGSGSSFNTGGSSSGFGDRSSGGGEYGRS
jgi:gas vesicle protein